MRPRIASDVLAFRGKPGDEAGVARDLDHVGDVHPDILGSDVAAAEMVDSSAERVQHVGRFLPRFFGEDHRLAAPEG